MSINVGEVIAVKGSQVTLRIFEESNLETLFYDGKKYKGVSIREYIGIKRGFCQIVCIIEGEYLDENRFESENNKKSYVRKVDVKPIGYFEGKQFNDGIKLMPMIKDSAFLLDEKQVIDIFSQSTDGSFKIGKMLKEGLEVSLPWDRLFNSHIGIFGNTGSGKSNTLTKLYTELFSTYEERLKGKSQFILVDFNGEYTGTQLLKNAVNKKSYKLSTKNGQGDKLPLPSKQVWNTEILALLFQATANTQTPFLNRVVENRNKYVSSDSGLKKYIIATFHLCFVSTSQLKESLIYLKLISKKTNCQLLQDKVNKIFWYDKDQKNKFTYDTGRRGSWEWFETQQGFDEHLIPLLDQINVDEMNAFDELIVRINIQMLRDLQYGNIQSEHIQPLLKRVESSINDLGKIFDLKENMMDKNLLTVISLRDCNQVMKKIVPLLLAKTIYQEHRDSVENPPDKTLHLIVDEAHNILSQQSSREHEVWKDYRLELFEEIIKEGRKFGMFLTLSSQRPADISPTIMSQLHNFFIHRLVNDKDLYLIDNTISTLDSMSKSLIPNLSKGSCVVTGTAFDIPIVMQVDFIEDSNSRPDSDDVNLKKLWCLPVTDEELL